VISFPFRGQNFGFFVLFFFTVSHDLFKLAPPPPLSFFSFPFFPILCFSLFSFFLFFSLSPFLLSFSFFPLSLSTPKSAPAFQNGCSVPPATRIKFVSSGLLLCLFEYVSVSNAVPLDLACFFAGAVTRCNIPCLPFSPPGAH